MRLPALLCVVLGYAAGFPSPLWTGAATQPEILDQDMHKLNEYLQAEKATSTNSTPPINKKTLQAPFFHARLYHPHPFGLARANSGELVRRSAT